MTAASTVERLARELLLAAAEADVIGVRACFLAVADLDPETRDAVLARVDGLGARCLGALAHLSGVTPAEVLDALTGRDE